MNTDHPEWTIRCPWCGASPGQRCTTPNGRRIAIPSHDARITAHAEQTRTTESEATA
ncbi:hypothetical protein ACFWR9_08995 [Streptomyces sp. NPDC058534]|uniref:zinc finger domain-containing protein n=1 Tax=Streptomyces sp. NPDC058534 TaxID=3346541 RepID=UPI003651BC90